MLLTQRILDPFLNLTFSSWTPSGERYLQRLCRDGTAGRLSCLSWEKTNSLFPVMQDDSPCPPGPHT